MSERNVKGKLTIVAQKYISFYIITNETLAETDPMKMKEIWKRQYPLLIQLSELNHYIHLINMGEMENIHNCPSLNLLLRKKL